MPTSPFSWLTALFILLSTALVTLLLVGVTDGAEFLMYAVGWVIAGHGFQLGVFGYKLNATIIFLILLILFSFKIVWTILSTFTNIRPNPRVLWIAIPLTTLLAVPLFNAFGLFLMTPYLQSHGEGPYVFNQLESLWESTGWWGWTKIGGRPFKILLEPGMAIIISIIVGYTAIKAVRLIKATKQWENPI